MNDYIYYFNAVDMWMQSVSQRIAVEPYVEPIWLYVVVALCCKLFYLYRDYINHDVMFESDVADVADMANLRNQFPILWVIQLILMPFILILMQAILIPLFSSIYVVLAILLLFLLISFFAVRAHRLRRVADTFKTLQGE